MYPSISILTRSFVPLLLLGLVGGPHPVQAETINCTPITAAPFIITAPGIYCLTQDIATNLAAGAAITIDANNVVLDLNGHRLGNLAAGAGTEARGVEAVGRKNLAIKNGTVRGFFSGIHINDSFPFTTSQGHVIEDIRADLNTGLGIVVAGRGNLIRNNQVVATGGSTLSGVNVQGIAVAGSENRVQNNDVIDTFATGGSPVSSIGISFSFGSDGLAVNNRITQADIGIEFSSDTGKFRDNLTSGVTVPVSHPGGVTDAGGNN